MAPNGRLSRQLKFLWIDDVTIGGPWSVAQHCSWCPQKLAWSLAASAPAALRLFFSFTAFRYYLTLDDVIRREFQGAGAVLSDVPMSRLGRGDPRIRQCERQIMGKHGFIAIMLCVQVFILASPRPASAISVELAKQCRDLAIKSHPPAPAGTTPYAAAERDFFSECIKRNGDMTESGGKPTEAPPAQK